MIKRMTLLTVVTVLLCSALPALGGEIHRAIEAGDVALVKQILKDNPGSIHERDDSQFRELPIQVAAATGNIEIARLLLEAGAEEDFGASAGAHHRLAQG